MDARKSLLSRSTLSVLRGIKIQKQKSITIALIEVLIVLVAELVRANQGSDLGITDIVELAHEAGGTEGEESLDRAWERRHCCRCLVDEWRERVVIVGDLGVREGQAGRQASLHVMSLHLIPTWF